MAKDLVQIDSFGIVSSVSRNTDQYNYEPIFENSPQPLLIDSNLSLSIFPRTVTNGNGFTFSETVHINPYTEQVLSGPVVGDFRINEQVFQSTITPQIINTIVIGGATATQYAPTIGSIGITGPYLGTRAAQFKGSYLDLNQPGAGIQLPPINTAGLKYFMVEGFVYFESFPSNYDPIIISRGAGPAGTTQDSFSVEYDRGDERLLVRLNLQGPTGAGLDDIFVYISPNPDDPPGGGGVTLGKWHHFAFYVDSKSGETAGTYGEVYIKTFFDGKYRDTQTISIDYPYYGFTHENVRNSTFPITVGCGFSANRPFKGWLDSIIISGSSTSSDALRGYMVGLGAQPDVTGITAPWTKQPSAGDHTIYALSMNGPVGTSLFPCDTAAKVVSSSSYISPSDSKLGVALVAKQQTSPVGITLFNGVCYGHSPSNGSAGYVFGYDSGACMVVSDVEQLHGITRARQIRSNAAEQTISYLIGATAMYGMSGASGDFIAFFSKNWGGNTFSYLATQSNTLNLRFIYDTVVVSGRTGNFYVKDFNSNTISVVQTADVKNLYADVVEYHAVSAKIGASAASRLLGITSMQNLYASRGFEDEAIIQKVAPYIDQVGILFINPNGRVTKKTKFSEREFTPYTIRGIDKGEGGSGLSIPQLPLDPP